MDEKLNNFECTYDLSIYLKGDFLNPSELTELLGVEATKSFSKGQRWVTAVQQKEVVRKTGLWALNLRGGEGEELSGLISRMKAALAKSSAPLDTLPGV